MEAGVAAAELLAKKGGKRKGGGGGERRGGGLLTGVVGGGNRWWQKFGVRTVVRREEVGASGAGSKNRWSMGVVGGVVARGRSY